MRAKSLTEEIYQHIYDDILMLKLKPGQRLHIQELCDQYDAGLSPVREALMKLTATDFVVAIAQRGFRVAEISAPDLTDIYRTRAHIEVLALKLSIEQADDAWEAALIASQHRLEQFETKHTLTSWQDYQEWEERHRAFNLALIGGCRLAHLVQIQEKLYRQTERYRRLWVSASLERRDTLAYAEKQKIIMEAALKRDVALASKLLYEHFDKASLIIRNYLVEKGII